MRNLRALIGFALVACGLLSLTQSAHAARRSGLAGSLLIEDKDDMFFFPQLLPRYRNLIGVDYGATSGAGNAVLTLGDEDFAWGVALHRGNVMTPHLINELAALNGPSSLFGAPFTAAGTPATIVDFLLGSSLGGDSAWGLRASIGRGADFAGNDADTGESEMFLMAEVGYGWGTRGLDTRIDLSGSLLLDFGSVQNTGTDVASGTNVGFSALMRGYAPIDATMDLGFLGNIGINSNSITADSAPMEPSASTLAFTLGGGIGPAFRFGPATVAAYGVLRALIEATDPNSEADDDAMGEHTIIIPGVHMALEVPLSDWLYVRSGAEYAFRISGSGDEGGGPTNADDTVTASNTGVFGWNAGLGVVIDNFRFDGSLQHGFVTGGPEFIGGTSPGFLAIASLTYVFDGLRSGEAVAPEAAPEPTELPPTVPEPALEPAPPPPAPPAQMDNPEVGLGVSVGGGANIQTAPAPAPAPAAPAPAR